MATLIDSRALSSSSPAIRRSWAASLALPRATAASSTTILWVSAAASTTGIAVAGGTAETAIRRRFAAAASWSPPPSASGPPPPASAITFAVALAASRLFDASVAVAVGMEPIVQQRFR